MKQFDVVIIGAGAAGLMCALTAGQRGRRVLLLDHADRAGAKILISGGGRCNFTNLSAGHAAATERFISANPHFCKSALSRYTPRDFVALVEKHGIAYHEKTLGQLFCDGSARAIVAMLLAECDAAGVDIRLGHRATDIGKSVQFSIATDHGDFAAASVVLASGGLSIPKMGATGFAHDIAGRFGLGLTEIAPALVPLTFGGADLALMQGLSGVAVDIAGRIDRRDFREAMLFTHRGLSGPAILQLSSYWRPGAPLTLDLLPQRDAAASLLEAKRTRARSELQTILTEMLPQRLVQALSPRADPPRKLADTPDRALTALAARLNNWRLTPAGTEGYAKAEVTRGGVDTRALSSRSMMANAVPGLYVIGEAVDVTGWLGGYNFQWAWASGWCAGQEV